MSAFKLWHVYIAALFSAWAYINCSPARAELRVDYSLGKEKGWEVGFSEQAGGCIAETNYEDESKLFLGLTSNDIAYIAFISQKWRSIQSKHEYQISFRLSRTETWSGKATGFAQKSGSGYYTENLKTQFIRGFVRADGVIILVNGERLTALSLAGSETALQNLISCQKRWDQANKNGNVRPADTFGPEVSRETVGTGSGFFVSKNGHVLTANHVAGQCGQITVVDLDGAGHRATIISVDKKNDLALLWTGWNVLTPASFESRVRLGEAAFVYGYPLGQILASTGNFTSGTVSALVGFQDDSTMLQISAPVQPGNSGGAVLNDKGNVVGVVSSKLNAINVAKETNDIAQNVNFAIKSSVVVSFLEALGLQLGHADGDRMDSADLAEVARRMSVKVICQPAGATEYSKPPSGEVAKAPEATNSVPPFSTELGKSFMRPGDRTTGDATLDSCKASCFQDSSCKAVQFNENGIYLNHYDRDQNAYAKAKCQLFSSTDLDTVATGSDVVIARRTVAQFQGSESAEGSNKLEREDCGRVLNTLYGCKDLEECSDASMRKHLTYDDHQYFSSIEKASSFRIEKFFASCSKACRAREYSLQPARSELCGY